MRDPIHTRSFLVLVLTLGGLVSFGKDLVAGVAYLYRAALTPQGLAVVVVVTMMLSGASLAVSLIRGRGEQGQTFCSSQKAALTPGLRSLFVRWSRRGRGGRHWR